MNNGSNIPDVEPGIPPQTPNNAVSVYGQNDAMDDFPVLKAFQQYVDAEQAKAQKRMTTLCVFFAIILAIVVGVFVMLIMSMSDAKNDANEKLIQFMIQDRERRQNVVVQTPQPAPQSDAAIKALTDTVTTLQKQLAEQQIKLIEEKQKAAEEAVKRAKEAEAAAAQAVVSPSADQLAQEKKNQSDLDRLAKVAADLKKQKQELADEKERLRQREIEFQRRRLYPDYYEKTDSEKAAVRKPAPAPAKPNHSAVLESVRTLVDGMDDDEEDDAEDLDDDEESLDELLGTTDIDLPGESPSAKPAGAASAKPAVVPVRPIEKKPPKAAAKQPSASTAHDALLKGNGATSGWAIPLE